MSENYNLYKEATELVGIGVWEYNLSTKMLFWDDMTRMIYETDEGYNPSLIDTVGFFPQLPGVKDVENKLEKIIARAPYLNCHVEIKTSKGNYKWISSNTIAKWLNGECIKLMGTVQDIADPRTAMDIMDKIRKTEMLIKKGVGISNIINSRKIGAWEWHIETDVLACDERCATILGYSEKKLLNTMKKWLAHVHPEDLTGLTNQLEYCFLNKTDYNCEHRIKHQDGNWIWIESHGEVIEWSATGKPLIMLGTEADITAKKQIELDQKRVMDLLSVQNERLTNFAYIVSHNLRSHAGNFQMMLDLYADEQVEEEKEIIINLLRKNAGSLSDTLSNLNEVVDIQLNNGKQLKTLNLGEQVDRALTNLKGMIDKEHARFDIHIDPAILIEYRPAYLESVLLNLFSNALKYRHPFRAPEISVEAALDKDGVVFKISDNGLGIDLKLHGEKIFGMYKTFHPHKDARGIGLFLTKNQVEAMGGKIEVESVYGTGTTFTIYIIKYENNGSIKNSMDNR